MISVQSRQRRLSGNSLWLWALILICITGAGCGSVKSARKKTPPPVQSREKEKPQVYNPITGRYEPVSDPDKMVDTIFFHDDTSTKPIGAESGHKKGKKSLYEVAFLIPFGTDQSQNYTGAGDPRVRRYLHYYGGAKMALQDLADEGKKIAATIYDTRDSPAEAKRLIQSLDNVDVVVGPYEAESLRDAASFSSRNEIPVFSPWTPSIPLDTDNPYFIQLTPGLEAHAAAMVSYIDAHLSTSKVYMVARNDPKEKNRLQIFTDAHAHDNTSNVYEELIIQDASPSLEKTDLEPLLVQGESTVFIMPFYSRNDEDFVNSFLRKLHADKSTNTVYVFGMPQWLTFGRLNPDYLESANVHLSTAHFMDTSDPDVHAFQKRFMALYGTLPEPAAYQAFTFVHYLGDALDKYGTGFTDKMTDGSKSLRSQYFDIVPVYRNPMQERQNVPNFMENQAIHILRFTNHAFRQAD